MELAVRWGLAGAAVSLAAVTVNASLGNLPGVLVGVACSVAAVALIWLGHAARARDEEWRP
jgi:uncharacterized membrane protein